MSIHSLACFGTYEDFATAIDEKINQQPEFSLNAVNSHGVTLLQAASFHGQLSIVEFLLNRGCSPNEYRKHPHSATALHYAVNGNQHCVLESLLNFGGDPFLADYEGVTAWDMATKLKHSKCKRVISSFLSRKFDAEQSQNKSFTFSRETLTRSSISYSREKQKSSIIKSNENRRKTLSETGGRISKSCVLYELKSSSPLPGHRLSSSSSASTSPIFEERESQTAGEYLWQNSEESSSKKGKFLKCLKCLLFIK